MVDLKKEAKAAGEKVVVVGIAAAGMALLEWIKSRPIKRAIARHRAKKAEQHADDA